MSLTEVLVRVKVKDICSKEHLSSPHDRKIIANTIRNNPPTSHDALSTLLNRVESEHSTANSVSASTDKKVSRKSDKDGQSDESCDGSSDDSN